MIPPELSPREWEALARAYTAALMRGEYSAGMVPAVAVRLSELAWAAAAVELGGAGLLRLRDKLVAIQGGLAFCETVPQIATDAERTPKPEPRAGMS